MTQDDSPAASVGIGEEKPTQENVPASPAPEPRSKPSLRVDAGTPDPFAVGVRVLRMAPAWLLTMTAGCSVLILLLGWMKVGGAPAMLAHPSALNDARATRAVTAADAASLASSAHAPASTQPAGVPPGAPPAPVNNPASSSTAQAASHPAQANPAAEQHATAATAATPQTFEKTQAESPARAGDSAAKFTVQVGSFNNQSEANERVSALRGAGFEARVVAAELQGRGTWYRVQVGRFADRGQAAKSVEGLRAKGAAAGAIVVPAQN